MIMSIQNNVFCWNCREVGNGEFLREMREFGGQHRPTIIILLEPRISGAKADAICRKLDKNRWVRSDAEGYSKGIWCLWNDEDVFVQLRYAHTYFLHFVVCSSMGAEVGTDRSIPPPHMQAREGCFGIKWRRYTLSIPGL